MGVDVASLQGFAGALNAFIVDEADIGLMPRGVEEDDVAFSNPIVTNEQVGGSWVRTTKWKDCGVEPIIAIERLDKGCKVVLDQGGGRSEIWNSWRNRLDPLMRDAGCAPRNSLTKRAREEQQRGAQLEEAADKIKKQLDAAAKMSESIRNASNDMTWRTARFSVDAAAGPKASLSDVAAQREMAADHFVKSGLFYLSAGVIVPAAEALNRAAGLLFSAERRAEAAMWEEAAWRLDPKSHDDWASFAVSAWSFAVRDSSHKAFELSHALRVAWSAQKWNNYHAALEHWTFFQEVRGDYAKAAEGYVRRAWASLQAAVLDPIVGQLIAANLENALTAWELAERFDMVKRVEDVRASLIRI